MTVRSVLPAVAWLLGGVLVLYGLHAPLMGLQGMGLLLDPWDGLYRTARMARYHAAESVSIDGLAAPVVVERDVRGVPHIFAENDWDAIAALGYVVAQDRLFQMDFVSRVVAGRLSEIFGPSSVPADRFLRSTGMDRAAEQFARRVKEENGLEKRIIDAYARGANAYITRLLEAELPFEYRLFGYRPEPYSALTAARLIQYFNYELSYVTDDAAYGSLREQLGAQDYAELYPLHDPLSVPVIPRDAPASIFQPAAASPRRPAFDQPVPVQGFLLPEAVTAPVAEGYRKGKGSNSWVVFGDRSATGRPLIAGDMHLKLSLPATWYEAHLVTPDRNLYGVLSPGAPLLVEAFSDSVAWMFTNAGADAIDYFALELDGAGRRYRFDGSWRDLHARLDTIVVRNKSPVVDTLWYTHHGPLRRDHGIPLAMQWAAHDAENYTLTALWEMSQAKNVDQIDAALAYWGAPAQNVLSADAAGNVAVRSAGHVPRRRDAGPRAGVLDGTTSASDWSGRIAHRALPHAKNPSQGFLASSNQQPTGPEYPYYLGHNWDSSFRSMRLDALLRGKDAHSLADARAYQRDIHVVQRDLLAPHLRALDSLPAPSASLRAMLLAWDGEAATDRSEPMVLYTLLETLENLAWDEDVFEGLPKPRKATLLALLDRGSPWLDNAATPMVEGPLELLGMALAGTASTLAEQYGDDPAQWRWGLHHTLVVRHLTQTPALEALWSKQYEFPGFDDTLAPGAGLAVTQSASWRMIVDFSTDPVRGYGVYFGGQSGNPLSALYERHVETYLSFDYYELARPAAPGQLKAISRIFLRP